MTLIREMAPVHVIVHYPKTKEGELELSRRAADVHASAVIQRLNAYNCPNPQKLALLDAIIRTIQESSPNQP